MNPAEIAPHMIARMEREIAALRKLVRLRSTEEVAFHVHFRVAPAECRVLGALYRANGPASLSRLAESGSSHNSVKVRVSALRGALDEHAIETVERGYRLTEYGRALCDEALASAFSEAA